MTDETINTLEQPGEFDVLARLRPNEPYFVLVGRDVNAPATILRWADDLRTWALTLPEGPKRDRELRKATQAEQIAWAMQSYRAGYVAEQAEEPTPPKPYSGTVLDAATMERDRQHKARMDAARAVSQAYSELNDLADIIEVNDSELATEIRAEVDRLRAFYAAVSVKRPVIDTDAELPLASEAA